MMLTPMVERLADGRWKASTVEVPGIVYISPLREEVEQRMARLLYALRSPNIYIKEILPNGDVILTLDRESRSEFPLGAGGAESLVHRALFI